jgi:phage terminase small subunit
MVNTFLKPQSNNNNNSKTLTEKQQKFLDCLIESNGNAKQAAKEAGYSGNHYQVVKSLKNEILDLTTDILANSAPEAAVRLVDIMRTDKPIPQIANKLQAAQTILDRVGVTKQERVEVNHKTSGGVFILPAKKEPITIEAEEVDYDEK